MHKRKRVLITGGAGFIAHHVIDYLIRNTDYDIVTLDRLDYSGNLNRLHEIVSILRPIERKRVQIVYHDLKAPLNPQIQLMIDKPDIILHLAAGSHVDRSITFPLDFVYDNVVGTANILEYARTLDNLELFMNFGTDEVFGPAPNAVKYKEWDRFNSSNPYSATKAGAEELCVAYQNTYKMPIVVTHTMNVFGGRQNPEKFIPMCIRRVNSGDKIEIHANSERTKAGSRFYIHAQDVADAIFFIITHQMYRLTEVGDPFGAAKCPKFNIVGKEEIDNLTLAQMIAKAQGKELNYELVDFHSARPGHDLRYALDGGLLKHFGWEPEISLSERIEEVSTWSLDNYRWLAI